MARHFAIERDIVAPECSMHRCQNYATDCLRFAESALNMALQIEAKEGDTFMVQTLLQAAASWEHDARIFSAAALEESRADVQYRPRAALLTYYYDRTRPVALED